MSDENSVWQQHLASYARADELYKSGSLRDAIKEFRAALALEPNDTDTLWALADCYSELGNAHKAARLYRAALIRSPRSERGDLLYNLANALLDQRRPIAALVLYRRVGRKSSAYPLARRNARLARRMLVARLERRR